MTNNPQDNFPFESENQERRLRRLLTDLGERSLYDAVSQCNRCGYCAPVCPTQIAVNRENFSGRGRNQTVKMLLEGKLKKNQADETISTCLLCGACTSACYAKVPTADIVLEARRSMMEQKSSPAELAIKTVLRHPLATARWLKASNYLRKTGAARLAGTMGMFRLIGMPGLADAERETPAPTRFLFEILSKDHELAPRQNAAKPAKWIYFAPCGPNYLYPEVGKATVSLLKNLMGQGEFFGHSCCGLTAYNYGNIRDARNAAKENIARFENISARCGGIPVVCDCSSCAAFMKSYEQLFINDETWRPRAKKFSESVKDILETLPPEHFNESRDTDKTVTYHDSCRACHGQGIRTAPRAALRKILGDKYAELPESDSCCGGAGAFAFTQRELSEKILRRKISNIAGVQADIVIAGATSCLIQIAAGLKRWYPKARVMHYSVFLKNAKLF